MTTVESSPRPLLAAAAADLADHVRRNGPLPWQGHGGRLIGVLERAGLTGRGGAGFPTWRKLAAVLTGDRPVVIGNGAEGEPASGKDRTLLLRAPHLVLDGLQLAAEAVGAADCYLYVQRQLVEPVRRALAERAGQDRFPVKVVAAPDTFVAGEESAVVSADRRAAAALPKDKAVMVVESGLRGRPTLVQNVETLAQVALIARHGPDRVPAGGHAGRAGLVPGHDQRRGALAGRGARCPTGFALGERARPGRRGRPRRWAGCWSAGITARGCRSRTRGACRCRGPGWRPTARRREPASCTRCRRARCGLAETARIAGYLADQSARQCGPCLNGLPAMAHTLRGLADGERDPLLPARIDRLAALVTGRGACHHPDGTARLVRSALRVFSDEIGLHLAGHCSAGPTRGTA